MLKKHIALCGIDAVCLWLLYEIPKYVPNIDEIGKCYFECYLGAGPYMGVMISTAILIWDFFFSYKKLEVKSELDLEVETFKRNIEYLNRKLRKKVL